MPIERAYIREASSSADSEVNLRRYTYASEMTTAIKELSTNVMSFCTLSSIGKLNTI
jgi:hypothetical protein